MRCDVLAIGTELLLGQIVDTNSAWIGEQLAAAGIDTFEHRKVGDNLPRMVAALRALLADADAVIVCGGLGPTPDDVTRKAVATVLSRPLQLDEHVLASIRERSRRSGRKLPATVETMALIPRGAEVWPNSVGSAPGLLVLHRDKPVILLPGVPQEMEALAREHVAPYLAERTGRAVESVTLRTYGAFESQLHERIGALPDSWPGASFAYLPSYFGVDLRITVAGPNAAAVHETITRAREELLARVRGVLYAEGSTTMEEVVGELLVRRAWRIATAESCTGGLLAKRLTDVPGSSRYVERGFVTYSNAAKLELLGVDAATLEAQGAVSAAVAEQMAAGARARSGAEVGVGITGVAGPEGGSEAKPVGMVFVALASPLGAAVRVLRFAGSRATIRERSAQTALDLLRRHLLELPIDAALD